MKINYLNTLIAFFSFIYLSSCEKDVEIDVKDADTRIVVEAQLRNKYNEAKVILTETLPLYSDSEFKKISSAEVSITNQSTNKRYQFQEKEPGIYTNNQLVGIPGETYSLEVILKDGTIYTATDTMPGKVNLKGVNFKVETNSFDDDDDELFYKVTPIFDDPEGIDNYYQLIIRRDNEVLDEINIIDDLGFDGLPNSSSIYIDAYPGDIINIRLLCISKPVYEYLRGLDVILQQGSAAPTNPTTNIQGNALGLFKAYYSGDSVEVILPDED